MKTTLLATLLTTLSLVGMAQETPTALTTASQQTAFTLFDAVARQQTGNICFSPLSAQMALAMLQNGAAGNTLTQLQQALGTQGFTDQEIGQFYAHLSEQLTERPPYSTYADYYEAIAEEMQTDPQEIYDGFYPRCELANSLWTRPGLTLYDTFTEALRSSYDAGVDAVRFSTWEGIERVNGWVYEHTHGLIPMLYDKPRSSDLAVVLTNVLYFKGSWTKEFDPEATHKAPFLLDEDTYATVDMMLDRGRYECAVTPSFQTITLHYGTSNDFSMTLFVPLEGTELPPLTYDDWKASRQMTLLHINLYMPVFAIDQQRYSLEDILMNLGVTDAFSLNADFSRMTDSQLKVENVYQLSKISVNEKGTEAAALTVIEMPDGIDPTRPEDYQDFKADRPFYFTIQNNKANAILFAGRVTHLEGPVGQVNAIDALSAAGHSATTFDLMGRSVNTTPTRGGIYIRDGKKVVIK